MRHDSWTIWHFGGSLLLTVFFYGWTHPNFAMSAVLAFACGILWEVLDELFGKDFTFLDPTGWSWSDIAWDLIGTLVGTGLIVLVGI